MLFWQLNLLDKSLALSPMKPPTIHTEASKAVPMPALDLLVTATRAPHESRVFDAHYTHQIYLLSEFMGEASYWPNTKARQGFDRNVVSSNMERLDEWHRQATEVLDAAVFTKKPLLTTEGRSSIDQGLVNFKFLYYHLQVLLTRGCKTPGPSGRKPAENLLDCLESIHLDRRPPSGLHIWQLMFCPFAAFQTLVGHVLMTSKMRSCHEQNEQSLRAMNVLPPFLKNSGNHTGNPLVRRVEDLPCRFHGHAKVVLYSEELVCARDNAHHDSERSTMLADSQRPGTGHNKDTGDIADATDDLDGADMDFELNLDDLLAWWTNDTLIDASFDWFGTIPTGSEESRPST